MKIKCKGMIKKLFSTSKFGYYKIVKATNVDIPKEVIDCSDHRQLGKDLIKIWKKEGIFQIKLENEKQKEIFGKANVASKKFFDEISIEEKRKFIREDNYSGYTASMEERTGIYVDTPEVFTIFRDIPISDVRCQKKWPLHGPVPWPFEEFKKAYDDYTELMLNQGNRVLRLISLGLGLEHIDTLVDLTHDAAYNIRIIKYPQAQTEENLRGIGAHTDYGFLSLGNQSVEGLIIRPPTQGEKRGKNWLEFTSGMWDNVEGWVTVKQETDAITIYPGDMFQLITNGYLLATPHKVNMHPNECRYSNAFFLEPNFNAVLVPLMGENKDDIFHFGTHLTNMYVANCPGRITTQYYHRENQLEILNNLRESAFKEMKRSKNFISS